MSVASRSPVKYNDFYFRLIGSFLAAHFIVIFGVEETFFDLLLDPAYYKALVFSFAIAFILISFVYYATIKLDRRFDWRQRPLQRTAVQLFFAVVIPSAIASLLAALYFAIYGINILRTPYLQFDYPVIVLMIVLLNAYYLAFYFFRQWQMLHNSKHELKEEPVYKTTYIVQKGIKNIPIPMEEVSSFYRDGNYNYLKTSGGETHPISEALDEVQGQVDSTHFFRANRQVLLNFKACSHYRAAEFGKLQVFTEPPLDQDIIVSQKKVKQFKDWMNR